MFLQIRSTFKVNPTLDAFRNQLSDEDVSGWSYVLVYTWFFFQKQPNFQDQIVGS